MFKGTFIELQTVWKLWRNGDSLCEYCVIGSIELNLIGLVNCCLCLLIIVDTNDSNYLL